MPRARKLWLFVKLPAICGAVTALHASILSASINPSLQTRGSQEGAAPTVATFREIPLGVGLAYWYPVDVDGDGTWELRTKTAEQPARFGVFDPSSEEWFAGPHLAPIDAAPWSPVDFRNNGQCQYAYLAGNAIHLYDPATDVDSELWVIPYSAFQQVAFWGRDADGLPLVFIVTSDVPSGVSPSSTRLAHDLRSGQVLASSSGSGMYLRYAYGYSSPGVQLLLAETGDRSGFSTPGVSWLHEWRGFDVFDDTGAHLDRLVYWTYDGRWEPYVWAPPMQYVQVIPELNSPKLIALRFYNNNISGDQGWWLQRLIPGAGGYETIRQWEGPAASAVAFDLDGDGFECWLFPLATSGWERRSLLDGTVIDTVPGPANAPLRVGCLITPGEPDLYYVDDSILYVYQPDIPTGVFDDPETHASDTGEFVLSAHPNPFNSIVVVSWSPAVSFGQLTVYNALGQSVFSRTVSDIYDGTSATWDGVDSRGRPVASGVYLVRFAAREFAATKKIVILR